MHSGQPLALINGTTLTGMRTGALGGLSCQYLSPPQSSSLAIIGAGAQGLYQALAAAAVRPIQDLYVYDSFPAAAAAYPQRLAAWRPDIRVHVCQQAQEAAQAADIIICCSTSAVPVLPNDASLFTNKHIVAIGTYEPHKRELPPCVCQQATAIYVDTAYAMEESGDLAIPLQEGWLQATAIREFHRIVCGQDDATPWQKQTTLFKSVGIGLFDLCAAQAVYTRLKQHPDCLQVLL